MFCHLPWDSTTHSLLHGLYRRHRKKGEELALVPMGPTSEPPTVWRSVYHPCPAGDGLLFWVRLNRQVTEATPFHLDLHQVDLTRLHTARPLRLEGIDRVLPRRLVLTGQGSGWLLEPTWNRGRHRLWHLTRRGEVHALPRGEPEGLDVLDMTLAPDRETFLFLARWAKQPTTWGVFAWRPGRRPRPIGEVEMEDPGHPWWGRVDDRLFAGTWHLENLGAVYEAPLMMWTPGVRLFLLRIEIERDEGGYSPLLLIRPGEKGVEVAHVFRAAPTLAADYEPSCLPQLVTPRGWMVMAMENRGTRPLGYLLIPAEGGPTAWLLWPPRDLDYSEAAFHPIFLTWEDELCILWLPWERDLAPWRCYLDRFPLTRRGKWARFRIDLDRPLFREPFLLTRPPTVLLTGTDMLLLPNQPNESPPLLGLLPRRALFQRLAQYPHEPVEDRGFHALPLHWVSFPNGA